jgi:hypothetical protein
MKTEIKLMRLVGSILTDVLKGVMCVLLAILAIVVVFSLLAAMFMGLLYVLEAFGVETTADNLMGFTVLVGFALTALVVLFCRIRHHWKRLSRLP